MSCRITVSALCIVLLFLVDLELEQQQSAVLGIGLEAAVDEAQRRGRVVIQHRVGREHGVGVGVLAIQRQGALGIRRRADPVVEAQQDGAPQRVNVAVVGLEFVGGIDQFQRAFDIASGEVEPCKLHPGLDVRGIELDHLLQAAGHPGQLAVCSSTVAMPNQAGACLSSSLTALRNSSIARTWSPASRYSAPLS
jgi:hypothetical protein